MVENAGNRGYLSDEENEDGLYPIWGVAIGSNDITIGHKSKEPKLWRPSVLEEAASTLEGKDIVVNHENKDAYEVIGEIAEAKFDEEQGVLYQGEIDNAELAKKIEHGWLEVSPRIVHSKDHEMVEGVKVPESIREFDNLSIVRKGAAGSNEVNLGENEELSVEELQESFEAEEESVVDYERMVESSEVEELQDDFDYAQHLYEDREGAEGAAEGLGCEGSHEHTVNGKKWYMPCQNHDKFLQNIKGEEEASEYAFEVGDVVETPSGKGEVEELTETGAYEGSVENGRVEADEDDPAAQVALSDEDGEVVAHNLSELSEWEEDEEAGGEIDEELQEYADKNNYSTEETRVASQMASLSPLTKVECLSMMDALNPDKKTDVKSVAKLIHKIMEEEERQQLLSEMSNDGNDSNDSQKNNILNRII